MRGLLAPHFDLFFKGNFMRFKKIAALGLLTGAVISSTGCSTMFGDNERVVAINSVPNGAKVVVNNVALNDATPTKIVVSDMFSPTLISVQTKGCKVQQFTIDPEFQNVGFWNILLWPGFVVDAATGDMMKIPENQRVFNVNLCQ